MLNVTCGKCGVALRIEENKLNPAAPLVKCPRCGGVNRVTLPEPLPHAPEPTEWGWLVVHDEATSRQSFPLKPGKNVIGRISLANPADIMIETSDTYLSRSHCVLAVSLSRTGEITYLLSDPGSTNGTFLNGREASRIGPYDQVYLQEGDVIQMGRTQVVLKTPNNAPNRQVAESTVAAKDYLKTIIL